MDIGERYPEAWQLMILYRMYWQYDEVRDDDQIARSIVEDQDREDFDAHLSEIREIMAMKPFPWETLLDWANRPLPDEKSTREWLENFIRLIEKHLAVTAP